MQDMSVNEIPLEQECADISNDEMTAENVDMNVTISGNTVCNKEENTLQYAGFFTRFAAFCIDSFITGLLLLVVRIPMFIDVLGGGSGILSTKVLFEFRGWDILLYLLTSFYFVALTYYSGATIGKRLLRIKVISTYGEKLSFTDVLYRETIGRFLCVVAVNVGYLMVGIDKEKRGFHDMLCDTRVIYDLEGKQTKGAKRNGTYGVKKEKTELHTESSFEKKEVSERKSPVSMAPSNYGYVPKSQRESEEDILWMKKQNESSDVDKIREEVKSLEEKE